MEIKVEIGGIQAAKGQLKALERELRAAAKHGVQRSMDTVERAIKNKLREKTHPRNTQTPSAPGEPPALITGAMMRSVRGNAPRWTDRNTVVGRVAPHVVQSRIQELGGVTGRGHRTHLPPRPYVSPAVAERRDTVRRIFEQEFAAAIRTVLGG